MKNIFYLIIAFLSVSVTFQSCTEDGDWENANGGQFGFTINRDASFIEKAVGESNQFKFNVVTNYDFATIPMKFKFSSSLNGELKLNGQVLVTNTEYPLTNKENIFEYKGLEEGTHKLTFNVTNDKGASKEEIFNFKYTLSDFTLNVVGGTADIYQGDETTYVHKITPTNNGATTGYEIRFDSYNGDIKFNGVAASLGQFYTIANLNNFLVTLKTNQIGQGGLTYTIKNINSTRSFSIAQTIKARSIVITSANPSALNVIPNTPMTLTGIISLSPNTGNNNIQYKTWISSATNNQMSGITTTNNAYVDYALGANGSFTIPFNAVQTGTYTMNLQVKDSFGNESTVKSFTIVVGFPLTFTVPVSATFKFLRAAVGNNYSYTLLDFARTFTVKADPAKISNIQYTLSYVFAGQPKTHVFNDVINLQNEVLYQNDTYQALNAVGFNNNTNAISEAKLKVKVTANDGTTIEQEINASINYN